MTKDDGFAEKLLVAIVRNVQVDIEDIHIRYEDNISIPGQCFALGATLRRLSFQTTDHTWKPAFIKENVSKIYKVSWHD